MRTWKSFTSVVEETRVPAAISTARRSASSMAFWRAAGLSSESTAASPCAICTSMSPWTCAGGACAVPPDCVPAPRNGATPDGTTNARANSGGRSSSGTSMSSVTPPSEKWRVFTGFTPLSVPSPRPISAASFCRNVPTLPPDWICRPLSDSSAFRYASSFAALSAPSRATATDGAFRSGAPWPWPTSTRRFQSISPLACANVGPAASAAIRAKRRSKVTLRVRREVSQTDSRPANFRASRTAVVLPLRRLPLPLYQRLHRLPDPLAQDQHFPHVGRRLLPVPVVQVEHVRHAPLVQHREDQRAERHLLPQRGEEPDVRRRLLQRPHVVAARPHHQRERRLAGERQRHLARVLGPLAEPVPSERHAPLYLKEERPRRLAPRGAQHDVRDRVAIRHSRQRLERALEVQRTLVPRGGRRRRGHVVPAHLFQRLLLLEVRGRDLLHGLGHDCVRRQLAEDRVVRKRLELLLLRCRRLDRLRCHGRGRFAP